MSSRGDRDEAAYTNIIYRLKKLGHTFGNDGVFWMSFADVINIFGSVYRTRLFDEKWTVVQQWNSINVGWIAGFLNTKFIIEVKKAGTVVVVLSQVRYPIDRIPFSDLTWTSHTA